MLSNTKKKKGYEALLFMPHRMKGGTMYTLLGFWGLFEPVILCLKPDFTLPLLIFLSSTRCSHKLDLKQAIVRFQGH